MINIENLKKCMRINGGFTAIEKRSTYVEGWGNITLAKSVVTLLEYDEKYIIICNVENNFGRVYYSFGETTIIINKKTSEIEMKFYVNDGEETYEEFDNRFNEDLISGYFSKTAKKYVEELCNILSAGGNLK